jgi:hypothetical protein
MQKLQKVIDENGQLRNHNNKLENDAEKHMQEQSAKITRNSYLFNNSSLSLKTLSLDCDQYFL